jgi:hypothetical protein
MKIRSNTLLLSLLAIVFTSLRTEALIVDSVFTEISSDTSAEVGIYVIGNSAGEWFYGPSIRYGTSPGSMDLFVDYGTWYYHQDINGEFYYSIETNDFVQIPENIFSITLTGLTLGEEYFFQGFAYDGAIETAGPILSFVSGVSGPSAIPEPSTYGLIGGGVLICFVVYRRRKMHRS